MDKALIRKFNKAFERINRHGVFSVNGSGPAISPGLVVEGFGPVKLPLPVTKAKLLRRHFEQAAYGKGTATVVDRTVRNVWRLPPTKFKLTNPAWDEFIQQILNKVQQGLGLHDQELNAHLYGGTRNAGFAESRSRQVPTGLAAAAPKSARDPAVLDSRPCRLWANDAA